MIVGIIIAFVAFCSALGVGIWFLGKKTMKHQADHDRIKNVPPPIQKPFDPNKTSYASQPKRTNCAYCRRQIEIRKAKIVESQDWRNEPLYVCDSECRTKRCIVCKKEEIINKMHELAKCDPSFSSDDYSCRSKDCETCFMCGWPINFFKGVTLCTSKDGRNDFIALACKDACAANLSRNGFSNRRREAARKAI